MTLTVLCFAAIAACSSPRQPQSGSLTKQERSAIADTIKQRLVSAYNLSSPDVVQSFLSVYPKSRNAEVISAAGGRVTASRDTLEAGIQSFWESIGSLMKEPKWEWGPMHVDVLSRDAAVLTTTYVIPHHTEEGAPHVIGGAWTSLWKRIDGEWVIVREHLSDMPRAAAERMEQTMGHAH
jgi:hypothetical protein